MIGWILDRIVDLFVLNSPRKGSLIPREDDIEPVRERVANDLLNFAAPCKCQDCICGFNKPDPNRRPGQ